jgi:predicted aminopeptidase
MIPDLYQHPNATQQLENWSSTMATQTRHAENLTGVSNLSYDLMTILTNKLEGITAIEGYKQDAQGDDEVLQCFERLQEQDRKNIEQLKSLLSSRFTK